MGTRVYKTGLRYVQAKLVSFLHIIVLALTFS